MVTVKKDELIAELAEYMVIPKKESKKYFEYLFELMTKALEDGKAVDIYGFGKLNTVETAARTGRNPATGEAVEIKAARKVKFTPSKILKDKIKA